MLMNEFVKINSRQTFLNKLVRGKKLRRADVVMESVARIEVRNILSQNEIQERADFLAKVLLKYNRNRYEKKEKEKHEEKQKKLEEENQKQVKLTQEEEKNPKLQENIMEGHVVLHNMLKETIKNKAEEELDSLYFGELANEMGMTVQETKEYIERSFTKLIDKLDRLTEEARNSKQKEKLIERLTQKDVLAASKPIK